MRLASHNLLSGIEKRVLLDSQTEQPPIRCPRYLPYHPTASIIVISYIRFILS